MLMNQDRIAIMTKVKTSQCQTFGFQTLALRMNQVVKRVTGTKKACAANL